MWQNVTAAPCVCVCAGPGAGALAELPQGQMDSLLSIISSQRERFRSRNQELEVVRHPPASHGVRPCVFFLVM